MKKGAAPGARETESVGGRSKHEIHHIQTIKDNGEVYDIDNLEVMTPKQHIESHPNRGKK